MLHKGKGTETRPSFLQDLTYKWVLNFTLFSGLRNTWGKGAVNIELLFSFGHSNSEVS